MHTDFNRRGLFAGSMLLATAVVATCATVPPAFAAQEGHEQKQEGAEQPTSRPAGEPVDFRKLKDWLPKELVGRKRAEATGQKFSFGDVKYSTAEGYYGENHDLSIVLFDYSNTEMAAGMNYWKDLEIDQESDTGYEKTIKVQGFAALETWQNGEGAGDEAIPSNGTLSIVISDTVFLQVNTSGLTREQFGKLKQELKLRDLAAAVK